jgi:tetratricopeptide (TPR) repeat protein
MHAMRLLRTVLLICAMALPLPAAAEQTVQPPAAETVQPLGELFNLLASAASVHEAREIELRISAHWAHTESPSVALIFRQAVELMSQGDNGRAREKLDALTDIAPDYVEGWSFRALVNRDLGSYARAVADLRRALEIEPRHFRALVLLGSIFEELDDARAALRAWEAAVEINPHLEGGAETVRRLTEEVKGRGI